MPLHADQTTEEQAQCFKRYERPKLIVATNVAQTSITIPDADAVIDSGLERRLEVVNGVERLVIRTISQSDAMQRRGRAGRTKDGIYIDHCPEEFSKRPRFSEPEIQRGHLGQTVLRLRMAGETIEHLDCFHEVDQKALDDVCERLRVLGCLDYDGQITAIGQQISRMPVSEQSGRMIFEAKRQGVLEYFPTIIAAFEGKSVKDAASSNWKQFIQSEHESDFLAEYNLVQAGAICLSSKDFRTLGLNQRHYKKIIDTRDHLTEVLGLSKDVLLPSTIPAEDRIGVLKAIGAGLIENIWTVKNKDCFPKGSDKGSPRILSDESCIANVNIIVGKPLDITSSYHQSFATELVVWASKIKAEWVKDIAPDIRRQYSKTLAMELRDNEPRPLKNIRKIDGRPNHNVRRR